MSRGQAISSKSLGMVEEHSLNGNKRVCATKQGTLGIVHPGFFFLSRGLLQSKPSGSEEEITCVASVSVLFRSKERGARVKDRAKYHGRE